MRVAGAGPANPGIKSVVDGAAGQAFVDILHFTLMTVSEGFKSYARILRTAWRERREDGELVCSPFRWSEVASTREIAVNRRTQWAEGWPLPASDHTAIVVMAQAELKPVEALVASRFVPDVVRVRIEYVGADTRTPTKYWFEVRSDAGLPY